MCLQNQRETILTDSNTSSSNGFIPKLEGTQQRKQQVIYCGPNCVLDIMLTMEMTKEKEE
jgi:hypothetical protein